MLRINIIKFLKAVCGVMPQAVFCLMGLARALFKIAGVCAFASHGFAFRQTNTLFEIEYQL